MGLWDRLTGTRRPAPEVSPQAWNEVRAGLLALNRAEAPFVVRDGVPEGVDLVCEWRILDPEWYAYFAAVGLSRSFQVLMRARPECHEVRSVDQRQVVRWAAGIPQMLPSREVGRGQMPQVERTWTIGRGSDGKLGASEGPSFSTRELKDPLREVVTRSGWTWKGALGRL